MSNGKFIVIEGTDNTGKSTICNMLKVWLDGKGIEALLTKHPGSTQVGQELRRISKQADYTIPPVTEALINAADNSAFIELLLRPALNEGKWVIGDRNNFISSLAYQTQSGASPEELSAVHDATAVNPPKIDALFVLRASKEKRLYRKLLKGEQKHRDRYEDVGSYSDGIARIYEKLIEERKDDLLKFVKPHSEETQMFKNMPCVWYIDANQDVEDVFASIVDVIETL